MRAIHPWLVLVTLLVSPALARAADPSVRVNAAADGAAIGIAAGGALLLAQIPVARTRWRREPVGFDEELRGQYSPVDAALSNATVAASIAVPVVAEALRPQSDALPKGVVYAEVLSIGVFLDTMGKYVVGRPRPYVYSREPDAIEHTRAEGTDAYLSFFSGHATAAFAAAVGGGTLFAYGEPNQAARALVWGTEMTLASATSMLRVRAGKHFPSDVLVGAFVGTATGLLVPRAHFSDRAAYSPSAVEWAAMGAGLTVGTAATALVPWRVRARLDDAHLAVVPVATASGAGLALRGVGF